MNLKKLLCFLSIIICLILSLSGCQGNSKTGSDKEENATVYNFQTQESNWESTAEGHKIELEYFNAGRYTSTIVENEQCIFWADSLGVHKYNKTDGNEQLITEGDKINSLSVYDDYLYFVRDGSELCRIDIMKKTVESLFNVSNYNEYLLQINDYMVSGEKIYFLNTFLLFSFDIDSQSVEKLLDSSVYKLQICQDTIYFIDSAEQTATVYSFSTTDKTVKTVVGAGTEKPSKDLCSDFYISDGKMYFSMRCPNSTYCMDENGTCELIDYDELLFSSSSGNGIVYMLGYDTADSYVYSCQGTEQKLICNLIMMNPSTGFSIVDGYVYYNSGVEIKISDSGHALYDYSTAKPDAIKIGNG